MDIIYFTLLGYVVGFWCAGHLARRRIRHALHPEDRTATEPQHDPWCADLATVLATPPPSPHSSAASASEESPPIASAREASAGEASHPLASDSEARRPTP